MGKYKYDSIIFSVREKIHRQIFNFEKYSVNTFQYKLSNNLVKITIKNYTYLWSSNHNKRKLFLVSFIDSHFISFLLNIDSDY